MSVRVLYMSDGQQVINGEMYITGSGGAQRYEAVIGGAGAAEV